MRTIIQRRIPFILLIGLIYQLIGCTIPAAAVHSSTKVVTAGINWSNLTATTLAALAPNEFLTLTPTELASIPANACSGFSGSQLNNVGSSNASQVCTGFQSGCMQQIPANAIIGLTLTCLHVLPSSVVGAFTAAQLSYLPAICDGFTQNQTSALGTQAQCQALSENCLAGWSVDGASGFQYNCIAAMNSIQIAALSPASIGALPLSTVGAITYSNNQLMTIGCGGFTAEQFPHMVNSAWEGWNVNCSRAFTPAGLGGWGRAQMRDMPVANFWAWTVDQVRGLSPLGASGISPAAAKGMPPALCAGFHASQIALFRDFFDQHVCQQLSAACLQNIAAPEFVGFTQECTQRLWPFVFVGLSAQQIAAIQPTTFYVLNNAQVNAINPVACAGITTNQIALLDYAYPSSQCSSISSACTSELTTDVVGAMTLQCVAHWNSMQCSALSADGFNELSSTNVGSLSTNCTGSISATVVPALTTDFISALSPSSKSALLQPTNCQALTPDQLNVQLLNNVDLTLSPSCLSAIPSTTCASLTADFFNQYLNQNTSLRAFTSACILAINCTTYNNLNATVLSTFSLTPDELSVLQTNCGTATSPDSAKTLEVILALTAYCAGLLLCAFGVWRRDRARKQELKSLNDSVPMDEPNPSSDYQRMEQGNK